MERITMETKQQSSKTPASIDDEKVYDDFGIPVDSYCVDNDVDTYDLYGERTEDESQDDFGDDLELD